VLNTSSAAEEFLAAADAIAVVGASIDDFIREQLGGDAYEYIQDEQDGIITNLGAALAKVVADELDEGVVVLLSNACENFLTKLADEAAPAVDLVGANGIISKAERLKAADVIAQKHMGYMGFLGQLRNASDHGIDTDINMDWDVTGAATKLGVFALLAAIKSVVTFSMGRAEF
jgi:hypothetical protein